MMGGAHMNAASTNQTTSYSRAAGTARSMHTNAATSTTTQGRFLPTSGDVRSTQTGRSMRGGNQNNSGLSANTSTHQPSINSLRLNVQSTRRFHQGDYRMPVGYQTRHWGYGERLPRGYFVRNYWIEDFLMFGLFAPPTDLIWVRVGNDALLVDRYSGDIVQVRYDVFY
jgi:Ni/Co efflux regulator RcnB